MLAVSVNRPPFGAASAFWSFAFGVWRLAFRVSDDSFVEQIYPAQWAAIYLDDGSLETMTCCHRDSQLASVFRPVLVTGAGNVSYRD